VAQAPAVPGNLSDPRNLSLYQQGQLSYAQNLSAIGGKLQNATASVLSDIAKGGGLTVDAGSAAVYAGGYSTLDLFAPYLLGIIAFVFVFIFTGVTFLRERSFGTFERLLVSPLSRAEIIIGYMLGFSVFAIIQSAIILGFAIFVLQVKVAGDIYSVVVLQLLLTIVGVNLGILCSSFAKNELQAVQFIPLLILPQIFLDGMFWPIATLPGYLQAFSYIMPLTYANDALQNIMVRGQGLGDVWLDVAALLLFAVVTIALSTLSLNKQLQ
jgi:ABC-2 type transport system permease protein